MRVETTIISILDGRTPLHQILVYNIYNFVYKRGENPIFLKIECGLQDDEYCDEVV